MNDFDNDEVAMTAGADITNEIATIGAGVGGGFKDTHELHVMKYKEAMKSPDKEKWDEAVKEELNKFKKYKVFKLVKLKDIPAGAIMLTTTWAMKKKANGTFRARVNMRGYEQIEGQHYDNASISSPVTNDVSVRTLLTIMIMANYSAYIVDIKGAFLHGEFDNGEILYSKIPEGFREDYNPKEYCWLLERTAYGLKQAARSFWNKLLEAMRKLGFQRSLCDPCVYYKWTNKGLVILDR